MPFRSDGRSADLETAVALRRLEAHLCRYENVADPASYYYVVSRLEALKAEVESSADPSCLLSKVTVLARALRRAVLEWQEGDVP